jgi:hypothetical protein
MFNLTSVLLAYIFGSIAGMAIVEMIMMQLPKPRIEKIRKLVSTNIIVGTCFWFWVGSTVLAMLVLWFIHIN